MNHIAIIGSGYVGLVTGSCLADIGHQVTCLDVDTTKLEKLKTGQMPFYEPGLGELVKRNMAAGRLSFETALTRVIDQVEFIFIAVGTPPQSDGTADLSQVEAAVREIGRLLTGPKIIVTKSTVPVGTNRRIRRWVAETYTGIFDVISCPEFLREGTAVKDFMNADRIVIGGDDDRARKEVGALFQSLSAEIIYTSLETAELIKYAANAFLATKISFINEMANLCDLVGANIDQVAYAMGKDQRIGPHFLQAGIGYGGSCFPKDVTALHSIAIDVDYNYQLLKAVIEVNNSQRYRGLQKIADLLGDVSGKNISVFGLAFKSQTDDIRESVAVRLIEDLLKSGARVAAFDYQANDNARRHFGQRIAVTDSPEDAARDADCILIATEWPQFADLDWAILAGSVRQKKIVDGRNLLDHQKLRRLGFEVLGMGKL